MLNSLTINILFFLLAFLLLFYLILYRVIVILRFDRFDLINE